MIRFYGRKHPRRPTTLIDFDWLTFPPNAYFLIKGDNSATGVQIPLIGCALRWTESTKAEETLLSLLHLTGESLATETDETMTTQLFSFSTDPQSMDYNMLPNTLQGSETHTSDGKNLHMGHSDLSNKKENRSSFMSEFHMAHCHKTSVACSEKWSSIDRILHHRHRCMQLIVEQFFCQNDGLVDNNEFILRLISSMIARVCVFTDIGTVDCTLIKVQNLLHDPR